MLILFSILFLALCAFDGWFTVKQMELHGIGIELNKVIRYLAGAFGLAVGTTLGVGIPSVSLLSLCLIFKASHVLAVVCGFRLALFVKQVVQL